MRHGTLLAGLIFLSSIASAQVRTRVGGTGNVGAVPQVGMAPGAALVPSLSLSAGLQPSLAPTPLQLSAPSQAPLLPVLSAAAESAPAPLSASRALVPYSKAGPAAAAANDAPKSGESNALVPASRDAHALVPVSKDGHALVPASAESNLPAVRSLGALVPVDQSAAAAAASERRLALTYDGAREKQGEAEGAVAGRESGPLLLTGPTDAGQPATPTPPAPPAPPQGPSPLRKIWDFLPKATALLIAANVAVYAIVGAASPEWAFTAAFDADLARTAFSTLDAGGMLGAAGRAVSSAFLHSSAASLLGNMAALALVGGLVEKDRGSKSVIAFYAAGMAAGPVLTALVAPQALAIGSAAAIMGLVAAFLLGGQLKAARAALREPRRLFSGADGKARTLMTLGVLALAAMAATIIGFDALSPFSGASAGTLGGLFGGTLLLLGAKLPSLINRRRRA
jgi:membrane associated rhomboid family serine protease